ncbi:quinone oxidoreductase family protein [Actomonas aquatica]|uniref:Zinc-binding dehydrogenase n=1 Tax=Actomonas aquatica TaxID=2866162 RepID=A0ABZ1C9D4_9BACT|nr:zinc-binding dehydrogenase [Opitutus sp. WL0086]WRQ87833.1 zinc-binding dehydrogenase [Opitutus sp. WL0086]
MRAALFPSVNELQVGEVADPAPKAGEVVVELKAAALNHRDLWIKLGKYAGLKWPIIPGSDGAGVVVSGGEEVGFRPGDEVILCPSLNWGDSPAAQAKSFEILGLPRDGTLAQQIAIPAAQLAAKPAHLSFEEAAALPLAGLTAYRALFSRAHLQAGERVLINGIGGGVALFALQFAVADGAEVWVTSSSNDKIAQAKALGAKGGFNYNDETWPKAAELEAGAFDVIVDSAGGAGFGNLVDAAAPGGRIVFFGATCGDPDTLPMRKVFWKQLSLLGTTMGSPDDWQAMLAFVTEHQIKPQVSATFPLGDAAAAFDLMEKGGQFGKIVVLP